MRPFGVLPNQLHRFYRGGAAIAELRGMPGDDEYAPEDWVGATNTSFGSEEEGVGRLDDGRLVRDAVAADPEAFLGRAHVDRYGSDPGLLVKLLDAGERLPVHFHPGRAFAREHLGAAHGKTEAWLMIPGTRAGAAVHVGFRDAVDERTVHDWVVRQDREAMLAALNPLEVAPGDALLIPAGVPHAIGEGVFMVEVQEPTDFSILLEWEGFAIDGETEGHLGLGFERALGALDRSAWGVDRLDGLWGRPGDEPVASLLPPAADPFFRAERVRADAELDAGFSILVVLAGAGALRPQSGDERRLARGDTVLVPYGAGPCRLTGRVEAIRCRPPAPDAGVGA